MHLAQLLVLWILVIFKWEDPRDIKGIKILNIGRQSTNYLKVTQHSKSQSNKQIMKTETNYLIVLLHSGGSHSINNGVFIFHARDSQRNGQQ